MFDSGLNRSRRSDRNRRIPQPRAIGGQNRRLTSEDGHIELSGSRIGVDRVPLQVGETWAEVRLMPWPARSLCRVSLGHGDAGCGAGEEYVKAFAWG